MSKPDKKITGGWAFLNAPDAPPPETPEQVARREQRAKARAWLKRRKWHVAGGAGVLLLLIVGLWFVFIRTPAAKEDHAAIQGEWRLTRMEGDDGQLGVRVDGDRWAYVVGGREATVWRVELNPAADPKEIELTQIERGGQAVKVSAGSDAKMVGVYSVDGKTLRVALAPHHNGRPKALDDPDAQTLTLTRAK
jgi:uncharacterized protein (TIGR03067 family)